MSGDAKTQSAAHGSAEPGQDSSETKEDPNNKPTELQAAVTCNCSRIVCLDGRCACWKSGQKCGASCGCAKCQNRPEDGLRTISGCSCDSGQQCWCS